MCSRIHKLEQLVQEPGGSIFRGYLSVCERIKNELDKKISQIEAFLSQTNGLYDGIGIYQSYIQQGIDCLGSVLSDPTIETVPAVSNLAWAKALQEITPEEVKDLRGVAEVEQMDQSGVRGLSNEYIDYLKQYETFSATPYRGEDSNNLTIGYGHVIQTGEVFGTITEKEATELLRKDMQVRVDYVNKQSKAYNLQLSQNQFDGLFDMVFNKGNILSPSSADFFKSIINGDSDDVILEGFLQWNKVTINGVKQFSLGVWRRSYDSAEIFLYGDYTRDDTRESK